MDELDYSKCRA